MDVKDHLPLPELKRLERVEKDADRAKRLRIIFSGQQGWTAPAVAMVVGLGRRICKRWVRRYKDQALAGLNGEDWEINRTYISNSPQLTPKLQMRCCFIAPAVRSFPASAPRIFRTICSGLCSSTS